MSQRNPPTGVGISRLVSAIAKLTRDVEALKRRPDGRPNASHQLPIIFGGWELSEDPDTGDLLATSLATGNTEVIASA